MLTLRGLRFKAREELAIQNSKEVQHKMKNENLLLIKSIQGRQSVPKSGRSERGRKRNFWVFQTTAPKNPLLKGYF